MNVMFALLPDVVLLDVAGPAEAFRIANQIAPGSYALRFAGQSAGLSTGVGLRLAQLQRLPRTIGQDTTLVIAGVAGKYPQLESPHAQHLAMWLHKHAHNPQVRIMCVCSGAVIAAQAGLLAGKQCTTHHALLHTLAQTEPTAKVLDNRIFVQDGNLWTSAGITAGIDLALHIIAHDCGAQVAAQVAREMVVYIRRAGTDPAMSPWIQHRNHLHPMVHRLQDAVMQDPTAPWTVQHMANTVHASARTVARLFAQHAGCTPLDYVHLVRFALAHELLGQRLISVELAAEKAGFSSAHQLRRVWHKFAPGSPRKFNARNTSM
jgi:transcriptional regulator GlxA family with amidase domain